jgi:hypothetical protein
VIRTGLQPPPIDRELIQELTRRIELISAMIEDGQDASLEVAAFNHQTGHDFDTSWFGHNCESRAIEDAALEAALPPPACVDDVTRDELIWMVHHVWRGDRYSDYYLHLFEANVPHPRASDLIFWPTNGAEEATAEQIVDNALSYRPIEL